MTIKNKERTAPIAIVGMAGRFPDAVDVQAFWRNLEQGLESLVEFSDAELLQVGFPPVMLQDPNFVKRGTVLEDADLFDAAFFGLNPLEAKIMDPQQRVFMECAWQAIEDAGYGDATRRGLTGMYAGTSINSYYLNNLQTNPEIAQSAGTYQLMIGSDKDFLATRVSYKLNLRGPSVSVQTACSTSLVAVQMACQALLSRQCDLALAGGVCVTFPQNVGYMFTEGMIQSPDGHCRPFDSEARGIRGGQGAGVVVLKRLEDALHDRDSIRAVILGAAINNDGAMKMGYTAPSVDGQSEVISTALRVSGVDPATIGYLEAHGTGTQVGDPIEIAGVERAYREHTDKKQYCAIGAVKANIGHLDAAAGIAGLIKTTLVLEHKRIPPTLHFRKPNPSIDFANSPFYVNDKLSEWPSDGSPRRAGVSSFGIGGTNAHAVLEEAPIPEASKSIWPEQLLVISARTSTALDAMTTRMGKHLEANPSISLADACYTMQVGRTRFPHRRMFVASNREEAIQALLDRGTKKPVTVSEESAARQVTFMFSGQGSQYAGMAKGLYQVQPVFRQHIDFCADFLKAELGCDLRDVMFTREGDPQILNQTRFAQAALFALEYSLAKMWMSWGVLPDAMIGHSIGEIVAACVAGVFSVEDALRMVAARGRIMQEMPPGGMLAVSMPASELRPLLDDSVSLAAVNAPALCTVSGPDAALAKLKTNLESRGVEYRPVHTSHAFHSSMMDGALDAFEKSMRDVKMSPPSVNFISNLSGTWIRPEEATDPRYWVKHLRGTVHFAEGIFEIAKSPGRVFLEIGPGQTLTTFARDCTRGIPGCQVLSSLPHPRDTKNDAKSDSKSDVTLILNTLGKLWLAGAPIQWEEFHGGEKLRRVSLPAYFFERQRCWVEPRILTATPVASVVDPSPKREDLNEWFYVPSWNRFVLPSALSPVGNYGPWVIFSDDAGLGDRAANVLSARKEPFVIVRKGSAYSAHGNNEFTIRLDRAEDYGNLLAEIQSRGLAPRSLLYLWNLPNGKQPQSGQGRAAFHSLIHLAQAFGDSHLQGSMDWVVVSGGIHSVTGLESLDPERALILGPVKVIPREYSHIRCRAVDLVIDPVPHAGTNTEQQTLIENLLLEPAMPRPWRSVAYRNGYRWEETFERIHLPGKAKSVIRERGVYLITGGMGGMGLALAAHLAENAHARLALTGRTQIPERADWKNWIETHAETDAASQKIREIEKLESLGAEVLPLSVDVSDRNAMQAAIDSIHARFGAIHGAIHAAGIFEGGLVQLKSADALDKSLSAKVNGTLVLDSVLRDDALDFLVLCSSIDSISPIAGEVDYSAANAFLDAFANAKSKERNASVVAINWYAWQEVGMRVGVEELREKSTGRRASLSDAIRPAEGVDAFRRVLGAGLPQVAVVIRDLPSYVTEIANSALSDESSAIHPKVSSTIDETRHTRATLTEAYTAPETEIQRKIVEIWTELLGVEEVGIDDNFFEIGGHSLVATGVLSRVRKTLGVSLPLRIIFEAPTIRQMASHLETLLWVASGQAASSEDTEEREEIEL